MGFRLSPSTASDSFCTDGHPAQATRRTTRVLDSIYEPTNSEAAITSVVFEYTQKKDTPERWIVGKAKGISVLYDASDHHVDQKNFVKEFERPESIDGGKHAAFYFAIIEPTWDQCTLVGDITINYDHGEALPVPNVEIDVLRDLPSIPD